VLTRAGQGLKFNRREQYVYHHLAYNFRDKLAEPFIVTVAEDAPGTEKQAHSHEGQEFDYVLSGQLKIVLGGNELYLQAGDSVYYNSALPHVMYALEGECRFIAVVVKEGAKA
jgi:quercetin dioxygenase-like cupin family protein